MTSVSARARPQPLARVAGRALSVQAVLVLLATVPMTQETARAAALVVMASLVAWAASAASAVVLVFDVHTRTSLPLVTGLPYMPRCVLLLQ